MNKLVHAIALGLFAYALTTTLASAQSTNASNTKPLRFLFGLGLTTGGDTITHVTFTNTNGVTDKVTAGGDIQFHAGAEYRLMDSVTFQTTLGYHMDTVRGVNFAVAFTRIPLELMGYYHLGDSFRVGGGARWIAHSAYDRSGSATVPFRDTFANTTGLVIEGEWLATPYIGLKLRRVTGEKYVPSTEPTITFKGDHVGVFMNFYFR
jgi:hypothetical protein